MLTKKHENAKGDCTKCPMSSVPYAPDQFTEWLVGHEHKSPQTAKVYISSLRTATKEHFRESFWNLHYNVREAFDAVPHENDGNYFEDYFINQIDARYWLEEFVESIHFAKDVAEEIQVDDNGKKEYSSHAIENQELSLKAYCRFLEYLTFENLQRYAPYDQWPRDKWIDFEREIKCSTYYVAPSCTTADEIDRIAVEPFESIKTGNTAKYAETVRLARKEDFRNWLFDHKYSKTSASTYLTNLLRLITEYGSQILEKDDWKLLTKSGDTEKMLKVCLELEKHEDSSNNTKVNSKISKEEISKGKTSLAKYILFLKDCLKEELQ